MGALRVLKNAKGPSVAELMDAQEHTCSICQETMHGAVAWPWKPTREPEGAVFNDDYVSFDHVVPESRGGPVCGNVLLAHPSCNIKKDNRLPTNEQLAMLVRVNDIFGWNGLIYENTLARRQMMLRRKLRGKEHYDYRDDPRWMSHRWALKH